MPYFPLRKQSDARIRRHERDAYSIFDTPETRGSCENEEMHPSFEIQTSFSASSHEVWIHENIGKSQETVVVISEPMRLGGLVAKQESRQVTPVIADAAVADAWLRMGETKDASEYSASQPQSSSSSTSIVQSQNIFRRTTQWWTAPCLNSSSEEQSATNLTKNKSYSSSFWLRSKTRRATDQSRNRSRTKTDPEVGSRSKPGLPRSDDNNNNNNNSGNLTEVGLFSSPTTFRHSSSSAWKLKQAVVQPLRNCCRVKPANQASLIDSPQPEASRTPSATDKQQQSHRKEKSVWSSERKNKSANMTGDNSKWKTAVDPKTGKTYYYHVETRETQWRKPLELASDAEKEAMQEKEQKQRDFFAAMEANILRNLQSGTFASPNPAVKRTMSKNESNLADEGVNFDSSDDEEEGTRPRKHGGESSLQRPDLVRTISSMDERILKDLVLRVPSHRNLSACNINISPTDVTTSGIPNNAERAGSDESLDDAAIGSIFQNNSQSLPARPNTLRHSNSRQLSLGSVLASLPEEKEPSMESFGDLSMHNMGLSEQESQALINFAEASSQMALLGDESFVGELDRSFGGMTLKEEDEQEMADDNEEPSSSSTEHENAVEEDDDPLGNMDDDPSRKNMARSAGSHRTLSKENGSRPRPNKMSRRNTCGTLYVGSTLSQPDVDATIKCVCGVIRAHILQSEMDPSCLTEYNIFNDQEAHQERGSSVSFSLPINERPSLDQISAFYRDVFQKAQMESDCVIMSLIYVERLIKSTEGKLRPHCNNWRSVLFSSMVLASKVWDDLSMWNGDFSQTCPTGVKFSLKRINELELAVLEALGYIVKVPASEYAKYYFLLRAMLIKSGLGGDSLAESNPLDVEGARRLQQVSSKYQRAAFLRQVGNTSAQRSKSLTIERDFDQQSGAIKERKGKVSLEHMVQM